MGELNIRTATEGDIPALARIYRRAALVYEDQRELILAHPAVLEFDADCVRTGNAVAAQVDGVVVGFASARFCDGFYELDDLFVEPAWFRRGVGSALIGHIAADARQRGASRIEVTGNPGAAAFYDAAGFVAVGITNTPLGQPAPRMHLAV